MITTWLIWNAVFHFKFDIYHFISKAKKQLLQQKKDTHTHTRTHTDKSVIRLIDVSSLLILMWQHLLWPDSSHPPSTLPTPFLSFHFLSSDPLSLPLKNAKDNQNRVYEKCGAWTQLARSAVQQFLSDAQCSAYLFISHLLLLNPSGVLWYLFHFCLTVTVFISSCCRIDCILPDFILPDDFIVSRREWVGFPCQSWKPAVTKSATSTWQ